MALAEMAEHDFRLSSPSALAAHYIQNYALAQNSARTTSTTPIQLNSSINAQQPPEVLAAQCQTSNNQQ